MSNVILASNDALCQSAKNWFIKTQPNHQEFVEGAPVDRLKDGDTLFIIAHDTELGDGINFCTEFLKYDFPMVKFQVFLIVCSAASSTFGKGLLTPAEQIANTLNRTVIASTTLVEGVWNDLTGTAFFKGDFKKIDPHTDITSLMEKLNIH